MLCKYLLIWRNTLEQSYCAEMTESRAFYYPLILGCWININKTQNDHVCDYRVSRLEISSASRENSMCCILKHILEFEIRNYMILLLLFWGFGCPIFKSKNFLVIWQKIELSIHKKGLVVYEHFYSLCLRVELSAYLLADFESLFDWMNTNFKRNLW